MIGAWMPPVARRCSANSGAHRHRGQHQRRVAGRDRGQRRRRPWTSTTGRSAPTAAYSAPRKKTSSAAPLASVVERDQRAGALLGVPQDRGDRAVQHRDLAGRPGPRRRTRRTPPRRSATGATHRPAQASPARRSSPGAAVRTAARRRPRCRPRRGSARRTRASPARSTATPRAARRRPPTPRRSPGGGGGTRRRTPGGRAAPSAARTTPPAAGRPRHRARACGHRRARLAAALPQRPQHRLVVVHRLERHQRRIASSRTTTSLVIESISDRPVARRRR